jgi:hypothetical protein
LRKYRHCISLVLKKTDDAIGLSALCQVVRRLALLRQQHISFIEADNESTRTSMWECPSRGIPPPWRTSTCLQNLPIPSPWETRTTNLGTRQLLGIHSGLWKQLYCSYRNRPPKEMSVACEMFNLRGVRRAKRYHHAKEIGRCGVSTYASSWGCMPAYVALQITADQ